MSDILIFDKIEFNSTTRTLSIKNEGESIGGSPFDLRETGVRLKLGSGTSKNKIKIIASSKPNTTSVFTTENFMLKMAFKGKGAENSQYVNMYFGELKTTIGSEGIPSGTNANEDLFHLSWIGSDDIRVNSIDPSGILLMEGEEMSFEIVTETEIGNGKDYLLIRYHKLPV